MTPTDSLPPARSGARTDSVATDATELAESAAGAVPQPGRSVQSEAAEDSAQEVGVSSVGRSTSTESAATGTTARHGPTRRLHVRHETSYDYDGTVELAHHLAHLRPRETAVQRVEGWTLGITPTPDALRADPGLPDAALTSGSNGTARSEIDDPLRQGRDGWGNWRCSFSHSVVHDSLHVVSSFSVELCSPATPDPSLSPPWEDVAERLRYHPGELEEVEREAVEFALASYYAPRDAALRRFGAPLFPPGRPLLQGALALMHEIHEKFDFRPHATSVATRATDALKLRKGVCQDFAHVMIGALRSLGLSARYVSGYLLTRPPPGKTRLVGADASHAWVDVWCPLHGWVALDPTNAVRVGLDHVTLGWGRDYADVAPLRGVIRGSGRAVPRVAVTVEPEDADA
jgi:transglutaminase-like putative cysteine protease